MQNKQTIVMAIIMVIIGAGAFYGGTIYEKSSLAKQGLLRDANRNFMGANGDRSGQGGFGQGRGGRQFPGNGNQNGGGDFVAGEVMNKDEKSLTIKTREGGSKIIFFSEATSVGKTVSGSAADLNVGQQVMINGKNNADGSLGAQNIQIRPVQ